MTCTHCSAVEQRGRYCVGCGKLMPPSPLPARRIRVAARPPYPMPDDATQPVLRFRATPRRPMAEEPAPASA
jgi:hypothetical protein